MYQVCEMDCGGIWAFIVSCLLHSFLSFLLFSSSPLVWSGVGSIPIANKMPAYSVNVPKTNKIHANIHASIAVSPMFKRKFCQIKPCYSVHNITVFYSCYAYNFSNDNETQLLNSNILVLYQHNLRYCIYSNVLELKTIYYIYHHNSKYGSKLL